MAAAVDRWLVDVLSPRPQMLVERGMDHNGGSICAWPLCSPSGVHAPRVRTSLVLTGWDARKLDGFETGIAGRLGVCTCIKHNQR